MKTYYLLRIFAYIVRFVPPRLAYWLCSLAGGVVFMFNHHIREAVMDNLTHVLPRSSRRLRRKLARKVVRNVVKNYYDVVRVPSMSPADLERSNTVYGVENLDAAMDAGKGAILITCHMGNFSIVAQLASARNYNAAVIAEDIEPPILYDYVTQLRSHFGLKVLKIGSSAVRTIYNLLRSNGVLLMAVDRDVNNEGMPVIFFGTPADMPHGAVALALRTGAALLPGYTMRLPNNKSVVIIDPAIHLERTGDRDLDVAVNMRKVATTLEGYILKAPDQWVVLQRIWDKDYTKDQGGGSGEPESGSGGQNGHVHEPIVLAREEATQPALL